MEVGIAWLSRATMEIEDEQEIQSVWRNLYKPPEVSRNPPVILLPKEGVTMEKPRDVKSKAEEIRSFLEHHQPKLPEARGFLQFLLAKEDILRRIEIVSDLTDCRHAILVSAKGSGSWPFFYRRGDRYFLKTSHAVVELMKFVPEKIYLCLSTDPPEWSEERQEFLEMLSRWHDELFAEELERIIRRQTLLDRIDEALAAGDRGSFEQLTTELRQLG
jgi:uncharacterized protein YpiB (UPF0302 family)